MWRVLLLGLHLETLLAESLFDVLDIIIFICFGVINGSLRAKHTDAARVDVGLSWIHAVPTGGSNRSRFGVGHAWPCVAH